MAFRKSSSETESHFFGHVQPHAIIDQLFQHKLLEEFILDVVLAFVFVEAIRIFIGTAIFIQRHDLVPDRRHDIAALVTESPPAHRNDERQGQRAHDGFEKPRVIAASRNNLIIECASSRQGFADSTQATTAKAREEVRGERGARRLRLCLCRSKRFAIVSKNWGRFPVAEEAIGRSPVELGVYPKAQVLNRFIAKVIDLLIVAAVSKLVPPSGPGRILPIFWWATGLVVVAVSEERAGSDSNHRSTYAGPGGLRESIIRNLPVVLLGWHLRYPCGVDRMGRGTLAEGLLVIGNEQGRRLGDEIAKTVLRADSWMYRTEWPRCR